MNSVIRPTPAARPAHLLPRPTTILLAEDEHLVAVETSAQLAELGFTIVGPASDGDAALRLASAALPDLAILDIRMPKRDGLETARELARSLGIPSIIMSAYSDDESVQRAREAGAVGFLVKPVPKDQLRVAIEIAWDRHCEFANTALRAADLERRLAERRTIEQAKWHLVSAKGLSEPEAHKFLQKQARDSRKPIAEIAAAIIGQVP